MRAGAGGPANPALLARNAYIGMIETARNVADRYGLTREEIDAFALRTQRNAKAARDSGRLAKEIMPVEIAGTRKTPARLFEHDEFIRDDTTAEKLAALPPQPGTTQMTAANSTPLTDGAGALVLASGERAAELGVEPLARLPKEKPRSEVAFVMNRLFAMRRIDCRTSSPDREVNWQCSPRPDGTPGREARFRRAFSATTERELASMTELRRQCRPAGMAGAVSVAGHPTFRGGNLLRSLGTWPCSRL
ncbi:thiolase family protein [Nocardia tengchongensis]